MPSRSPRCSSDSGRRIESLSLAEELDQFGRVCSRQSESDPAMAAQRELLALEHDLLVTFNRDVGAVCAVIGEDELIHVAFDLAVHTRRPDILDDQFGRFVTSEREGAACRVENYFRGAIAQAQRGMPR